MTRILIVDDDEDYCETVRSGLSGHGFESSHLLNGETALRFAKRYRADLALLDFHIGDGMTGAELARRFRADPATAAIPLVLASANEGARQSALDAGVDRFLHKPYDLSTLVAIVRWLTRVPRIGSASSALRAIEVE